ncbi:MAG: hypothetical protein Q4C70_15515, partial [Planctomycetia bacterium]|nr:hypothetical protein [Planctomycetia bacterium]
MQTKLQSLVDTAQGIGVQIPDGLTEGITSGEISPDEAVEQLQSAITGQMEGLADVARDQGAEVGEEMVSAIADGVEAGDTGAIMSAYNEIISQIGQSAGAALGEGMTTSTEFAEGAKTVVAEGTAAATAEAENFSEAGSAASEAMASGITAGSATIQSAAKDAVSSAAAAAGADTGQFQTIGANMAEGIARGMASRSGEIQRVARQAVAQAIAAAKAEGDIHSPSKKMEKEVGQWLSKGTAKGIKTHSKEVASEAAAMVSRAMYQAKAAATKSGKSVADALSDTTNFIIANNFGVSGKKTKTTGSGKNKKTETTDKSKTELSKDIMSAAESYFNNLAVLQDVSDQQELKYWKKVQKRLTKGSQAWYDAQKKINQAKAAVASNAAEIGTFDIASDVLKSYQDFYEMSEKAAEEYWDTVRKQFKEGTEDRVKADKEYFDAHKQYLQKLEDINADYLDRIDEKQAEYTDAVKDRAKELASAFDMFEEFESKSASGEDLLFNMQTQAAGYLDWADTLKKLADRGILSSNLMSELEEKGPENSAAIHALQDLSDEQLKAYQQAYNTKMDAASKQAEKEYEGLKQKVEEEVKGLKEAQASDISKVNTTLSSTNSLLASIASKIGTTSETGAASAAATFASEATKPSTQASTTTEAKTPTASAAAKKTKLQELEEIINSGKSRSTKLSKAEKEKHHALWEWIATTYGKAATNDMYKSLAKALGMKVGKSVSNEEKNMLLNML